MSATFVHYHDGRIEIVWSEEDPTGEVKLGPGMSAFEFKLGVPIKAHYNAPAEKCPGCDVHCMVVHLDGDPEKRELVEPNSPLRVVHPVQVGDQVSGLAATVPALRVHSCRADVLSEKEAREILAPWIDVNPELLLSKVGDERYVCQLVNRVSLSGVFRVEQLRALVWWLEHANVEPEDDDEL